MTSQFENRSLLCQERQPVHLFDRPPVEVVQDILLQRGSRGHNAYYGLRASEAAAGVWLTESCITTRESCVVPHGFCQSSAYSLQRQCAARQYLSLQFISLWVCALATRSSQRVFFPSIGCGMSVHICVVNDCNSDTLISPRRRPL